MASEYYVSAVKYNADGTHIQKLHVHKLYMSGGKITWDDKKPDELTRPQVVDLVKKGEIFTTVFRSGNGWTKGARLQITKVETEYLKTKNDSTTKDNLENLPTF